jgi:hypothetical protein
MDERLYEPLHTHTHSYMLTHISYSTHKTPFNTITHEHTHSTYTYTPPTEFLHILWLDAGSSDHGQDRHENLGVYFERVGDFLPVGGVEWVYAWVNTRIYVYIACAIYIYA